MGPSLPPTLVRFAAFSAAAHIGLLVSGVALGHVRFGDAKPPQKVLVTKLVKLGKERPEHLLPRKEKPKAPPAAEPVPVSKSSEAPKAESLPSAKDRVAELAQVSSALERLKKKTPVEEPEGRADGVESGEATSLAEAVAGSRYATEIYACIKQSYTIEGIDAARVRDRSAIVVVRIDGEGRFIDHRIERGSGLEAFDRAVIKAMSRCGRVSPPPSQLRQQVREDGLEVEFQP